MLFKGVLIAPGDYTWKHALMYVPATESKKSVGVSVFICVCVPAFTYACTRLMCEHAYGCVSVL